MGAIYGLALFRRSGSQREVSWAFWAYAGILLIAVLLAIISSVMSFMLRESIAHRFYKTDVMVSNFKEPFKHEFKFVVILSCSQIEYEMLSIIQNSTNCDNMLRIQTSEQDGTLYKESIVAVVVEIKEQDIQTGKDLMLTLFLIRLLNSG